MNEQIQEKLEKWFSKNTFHYKDFIQIHRLVKIKQKQNLSIGVCIPTKNEEKTVSHIVKIIKEELMNQHRLVDELIIMDSASKDNTAKLAKEAGAEVYQTHEVLSQVNLKELPPWGKGESIWKSIYVLNTDILIWVDGDIENFNSRFIYGLCGPLLNRPDLGFIKGFYQRPIKIDNVLHLSGGGRVTELCLRPLLNIFYPELSRVLQPLAGETSIRREIIEKIPICINYAVETCMLIDIYKKWGLEVIGQVDLKERIHRNQSLSQLSKLSFGLMQAVFNRLDIHGKVKLLREPLWKKGGYDFKNIKIIEDQRPPICEIKEYKEKFKNRKPKWPNLHQ